jgi:hypothetical protein
MRSQMSETQNYEYSGRVTYDGRPGKQEAAIQQPTQPVNAGFHFQHVLEEYSAAQPLPRAAICTHGLPSWSMMSTEAAYNSQYIAPGSPAPSQTPALVNYPTHGLQFAITASDFVQQSTSSHTLGTSSMAMRHLEVSGWHGYDEQEGSIIHSEPIDYLPSHELYEEVHPAEEDCYIERSGSLDGSALKKAGNHLYGDEEENGLSDMDDDELDAELKLEYDEGEMIERAAGLMGRIGSGHGAGVETEDGKDLWEYLMTGPDGEVQGQADDEEERNAFENELNGSGDWNL